jgi:arylformamidase
MAEVKTDWTDAYTNGAYIPEGDIYPTRWAEAANSFRANLLSLGRAKIGLSYGPAERNKLDLFLPSGKPRGLIVFVHGGYWHRFDRSLWSHLAAGATDAGWAMAMPSYTLAPDARIASITREIAEAINFAATLIEGPIRLAGHSAGGHLVTRMMCRDSKLAESIQRRLTHVVSISGLHDLRPLINTAMNETLKLDKNEAWSESPALLEPLSGIALTCYVGAIERPEFLRQNDLLANIWKGFDVPLRTIHEDNRHHFNIVEGFQTKTSQLTCAVTGDDGWAMKP